MILVVAISFILFGPRDVPGEVCQVVEVDGKNQLDCFWGRKTPIINDYDFTGWTAPDLVSLYFHLKLILIYLVFLSIFVLYYCIQSHAIGVRSFQSRLLI